MIHSLALLAVALSVTADPAPGSQPADRHDPFVFRCVLDENPRMLVISFGDGLWMSFDTTTCTVARVWKGDIEFTGTLYDHRHGPQPISRGHDVPWHAEVNPAGIRLEVDGRLMEPRPAWAGYRVVGDQVTLRYRLDFGDAGFVDVEMTPHVAQVEGSDPAVVAHVKVEPRIVRGQIRTDESTARPTTAPSSEVK